MSSFQINPVSLKKHLSILSKIEDTITLCRLFQEQMVEEKGIDMSALSKSMIDFLEEESIIRDSQLLDKQFPAFCSALSTIQEELIGLDDNIVIDKLIGFQKKHNESEKSQELVALIIVLLVEKFNSSIVNSFKGLKSEQADRKFWTLLYPICTAIPFLKLKTNELCELLNHLLKETSRDFAKQKVYLCIEQYATQNPEIAILLVNKWINERTEGITNFVANLICGLRRTDLKSASEIAELLLNSDDTQLKCVGIFCVANIFEVAPERDQNRWILMLDKGIELKEFDVVRATISVVPLIYRTNVQKSLSWLKIGAQIQKKEIAESCLYSIVRMEYRKWDKPLLNDIILPISSSLGSEENNLHELGIILEGLAIDQCHFVCEFMTAWIRSHDIKETLLFMKECEGVVFRLYNEHKTDLQSCLTKWLLENRSKYSFAFEYIIQRLAIAKLDLKLDCVMLSSLSPEELKKIIMRVLGYVSDCQNLCSLALSVAGINPLHDNAKGMIIEAFTHHISLNYPGYSRDFLNSKIANGDDEEEKICGEILILIDNNWEKINKLPYLNEFNLPPSHVKSYIIEKRRRNNLAIKAEMKKSTILNLFPKIILKGGRSFFSKNEDGFTEKSMLSTFESTFEVPIGEFLDPIGQAKNRINWRKEQMSD